MRLNFETGSADCTAFVGISTGAAGFVDDVDVAGKAAGDETAVDGTPDPPGFIGEIDIFISSIKKTGQILRPGELLHY